MTTCNLTAIARYGAQHRSHGAHFRVALLGLLAAGMVVAPTRATAATAGERIAAGVVVNPQIFSASDDPYPDHHVTFAGGVTGFPDVTYQILRRYRPMDLDLYLPPVSFKGPRPAVVFVHGGGWQGGGRRLSGAFDNFPKVLAAIARHGYVVAAVSYRFLGEAPSPAAIQDVKAAIRWLRSNAARYRVDKSRVVIFGGSAGGQLAALAATSCGVAALEPEDQHAPGRNALVEQQTAGATPATVESDCVQGAVTWYGVFDFATQPVRGPVPQFLGCPEDAPCPASKLAFSSPITYVSDSTPPMLIIAGSDDHTVPPAQSRDFYAALQARHLRSELMIIPGVDHSFIGKTPEATRDASQAALARTVDFFDRIVGDNRSH